MSKTIASKVGSESQILSVGSYRPKRIVSNDEVAVRIDSSDEWIQQRTGIETRRFADASESVLDMATWAAEDALKKAKLSITDIDTVISRNHHLSISSTICCNCNLATVRPPQSCSL
jgi:3-oxoacyl-[acyl-carrier-protein] synthase III